MFRPPKHSILIILIRMLDRLRTETEFEGIYCNELYKGTPLIGDCRAGIINSVWASNGKAEKERLRLISIDQEQLFTYEVSELEVQE